MEHWRLEMKHQYEGLLPGQIRLLYLKTSTSDEIHCELRNVGLDCAPPYEAISYRWQDSRMDRHVIVGDQTGFELTITRSLFHALLNLRIAAVGPRARILWAGAVCINQNDASEKSEQINRMGHIYYKAQRVVTYIGEGDDNTEAAIGLAKEMLQLAATWKPSTDGDRDLESEEQCDRLGIPYVSAVVSDEMHPHPGVRGLQSMFDASWSRRVWIIQESLLNDNMLTMCGRFEMPWTMLDDLALSIRQRRAPNVFRRQQWRNPDPDGGSVSALLTIGSLRKKFKRTAPMDIIQGTHGMLCSDPRDRVYALLGTFHFMRGFRYADTLHQYGLKVDYKQEVGEIYTRAALYFLHQSYGLELFGTIYSEPNVAGLPSWVPDWSATMDIVCFSSQKQYMASGGTDRFLMVDETTNRITLAGVPVGCLSYVSGEVVSSIMDPRAPDQCGQWLKDTVERVQKSDKYHDSIDALWRTFCADPSGINTPGEEAREALGSFLHSMNQVCQSVGKECTVIPGIREWKSLDPLASQLTSRLPSRARGRSFAMTETGYYGLVPTRSCAGDLVVIVRGGRVPLVLRRAWK